MLRNDQYIMYIGEASKKTGLSVKTIRFYESKGLIKTPRRIGNYRTYREPDIELLLLIKDATQLGISLSKLKGVIEYHKSEVNWMKIKAFLNEVRSDLVNQIELLQSKIVSIDQCCSQIKSEP